jgi:hypothetical protein
MKKNFEITTLVIILICLTGFNSRAGLGEKTGNIYYNLSIHTGTALPHNDMLVFLNREYIRSIEINTWFVNNLHDQWVYPVLGAGLISSSLGNRDVFGNIHAAYLSILNPLFPGRIPIDFKLNLGMAYATRKYDVHDNYFNRGIGSHLNMYGQVAVTWKIPVHGEKWVLRPGLAFHHVSNGTVVSPNSGINMLTIHAGMDLRSGHRHHGALSIERDTLPEKKNRFTAIFAPGIKQMDRRIDKRIFTSSLIFDYGHLVLPEFSIGIGIGFFYNDTWAYSPYSERDASLSSFQSALHISLQRDMGPLAFFMHPGTYIYMAARDIPYFTGRLGFRYKFENNMTAGFAIKHHWFAIADYFEWGIGYEFKR